ncbi:MAG: hypothetical protein J6J24_03850 [Clostridia bacterium]|nr:hypothetical protein [Clostridia bacterium]
MRERICNNCGGKQYKLVGQNMVKCCFCGALYVNETASKEEEILIVGIYEKLRELKFDEALQESNALLLLYPYSFEGYFSRALARNKIVFYNNKAGTKSYPVCFGTKIGSLSEDADFKKSIDLSPSEVKEERLEIAKAIDNLSEKVAQNQKEYDVIFTYAGKDEKTLQAKDMFISKCKEKGMVPYVFSARFKDDYAEVFQAVKTSKACVIATGKENFFTDASRKSLIDAYGYLISEKQKVASSLLLVCDTDKVDVSKMPQPLKGCKSLIDLSEAGFEQEFFAVLSREMNKTVKERARLEKKTIEQALPTRKEYVNVEGISPNDLGHYTVENIQLNDENKLKWVFLLLKNQDFATAKEIVEEHLQNNPNDAEFLFAQLMIENNIRTQEEFFASLGNFQNNEKIDKILTYATKDFAEFFVDGWQQLVQNVDNVVCYDEYLLRLASYNTPNRENFVKAAENKAIESLNEELIKKVEKCFNPEDVDRFINFYFALAQKSDDAKYYKKILEIDIGHEESNYFLLLQHFNTEEDILSYKNKEELENALKFLNEDARANFVEMVINLILPLAYKDLKKAQEQMDFYLAYLTDEKLVAILRKIAEKFKEMSFFKAAEKYMSLAINCDKANASLYWELIKIKAHCKNDQDLILSNVKFSQFPEWQTLLSLAGEEEAEEYAQLVSKSNLYKGDKKALSEERLDVVSLKEKLNEFLIRNKQILLSFEKENLETAGRSVEYYRAQFLPFEKNLKELDNLQSFQEYVDISQKIFQRLAALDLTLGSSIRLSVLERKNDNLKGIVLDKNEEQKKIEKNINRAKNVFTAKTYSFWFLEMFPLVFALGLLALCLFIPKDVYMQFSQKVIIGMTVYSAIIAIFNLLIYARKKKSAYKRTKAGWIVLSSVGFLNVLLLAFSMVFLPQTITIENQKEFVVLVKNANNATLSLEADIDLDGINWKGGNFYGELDGNGCTISGLTLKDGKNVGLFKNNYGKISELKILLSEKNYKNCENFGVIAVENAGEIENCFVSGKASFKVNDILVAGGLVAVMKEGKVANCKNELQMSFGQTRGRLTAGGLIGIVKDNNSKVTIWQNQNNSTISVQGQEAESLILGGMVGEIGNLQKESTKVEQNANQVNMTVSGAILDVKIGGLVGSCKTGMINNYVSGSLQALELVGEGVAGGLVGDFETIDFKNVFGYSYSTMQTQICETVKYGTLIGSLGGSLKNCFTNAEGEFVKEMKDPYSQHKDCKVLADKKYDNDLDFDKDVWILTDSENYPKFIWQD